MRPAVAAAATGSGSGGGMFRFFAPVGYNEEEDNAARDYVYYNANSAELSRAKAVHTAEAHTQDLLFTYSDKSADERLSTALALEAEHQLALMLYQKGLVFGLNLLDPLSAMQNHSDILLKPRQNHQCSSEFCKFFHFNKDEMFQDLFSQSLKPSSGLLYICTSTGSVHVCDQNCNARVADLRDESSGYVCAVSGQYKGQILDDMPQGRNVKVSRARIDAISAGHKQRLVFENYHPDEGDLSEQEDYANAPADVINEEKLLDEKEKAADDNDVVPAIPREEVELTATAVDAVDENDKKEKSSSEDELEVDEEPPENEDDDEEEGGGGGPGKRQPGIPKGSGEHETLDRASAFELPSDPDDRTTHFLRNPEQREDELHKLLESLLSYNSHLSVFNVQLQQETKRAHDQLLSYRRKHKTKTMSMTEQYLFIAAHVATYTAPMPIIQDPLYLAPYSKLILKAWEMMARSPYVRDFNKPRLIPNLTSTTLGLLYNMAEGPVIWDCSLGVGELAHIPPGLEEFQVRNLKVEIIPYGRAMKRHLLPLEQLTYLGHDKKKKTQGFRCFRDCLASTVERLRQEFLRGVAAGNVRTALIRYVNECDKLKCG